MTNIDRIKSLAKDKGVKISYICDRIGLGKTYIIDAQKNNRDIPLERLIVIADILDTTVAYLKGESDIKEKPVAKTGSELDEEIFNLFNVLTPDSRKIAIAQLEFLAARDKANAEKK